MDELGNSQPVSFDEVKSAAREENWDFVDQNIANFQDDETIVDWALKSGVKSEDDNERDLAVSILEKTSHEISGEDQVILLGMIDNDPNPYASYRAAFALFTHGNKSERVIDKIKEGLKDEDVAEISEGYLSQIEEK
jgi:HEAT repeat protein